MRYPSEATQAKRLRPVLSEWHTEHSAKARSR